MCHQISDEVKKFAGLLTCLEIPLVDFGAISPG